MTRRLIRIVSATLVATLAILASAAALCLVPCELAPQHAAEAASGPADHCAGAPAPERSGTVLTGAPSSCAAQHAWEAPAADRTTARTSTDAGLVDTTIQKPPVISPSESRSPLAGLAAAPAPPPLPSTPLRI